MSTVTIYSVYHQTVRNKVTLSWTPEQVTITREDGKWAFSFSDAGIRGNELYMVVYTPSGDPVVTKYEDHHVTTLTGRTAESIVRKLEEQGKAPVIFY